MEASLPLTGAMEEYEWAVKGMMELALEPRARTRPGSHVAGRDRKE